jgi:hypothetical protein
VKGLINQRFLRQTRFDSASPAGAAVVAHEIRTGGSYEIAVARKKDVLARLPFGVPDPAAPPGPQASALGSGSAVRRALSVDLAKLTRAGTPPELPSVVAGGWVSFTSSQPLLDHHILLRRLEKSRDNGDDLDSRRLGDRSLFGLTLIRPGRYSLVNAIGKASAEIVVAYPTLGDAPYRPPEPLEIVVGDEGFGAETFALSPAQGIVFRFRTESRIRIELVEPDDGPSAPRTRKRA